MFECANEVISHDAIGFGLVPKRYHAVTAMLLRETTYRGMISDQLQRQAVSSEMNIIRKSKFRLLVRDNNIFTVLTSILN